MSQQRLFTESSPDREPGIPGWPKEVEGWHEALSPLFDQSWWQNLAGFVQEERRKHEIYPPQADVFRAFQLTPLTDVRFVILGQDPYHGADQAHGLSFSVTPGTKHPPSLMNIFKELESDTQMPIPESGDLTPWASQGGLLLNTVLTVRASEPNSHRKQGWEKFSDAVIQTVNSRCEHVAFVLWGSPARKKSKLIDEKRHLIVESAHPSPLSAYRGFFGSKPFSRINDYRRSFGLPEIDWALTG